MFGFGKPTMVAPEDALAGTGDPMAVRARHRVLDTPLQPPFPDGFEVVHVAMGCFWGAERIFWRLPGVHTTAVGYMGGWTRNPTYEQTCTGRTGHTETVLVVYDPEQTQRSSPDQHPIEPLLGAFWENHDPTQAHRQGNDVGTQYRSAIYPVTDAQLAAATASRDRYQQALTANGFGTIETEIVAADGAGDGGFYYAEDYHQQYLQLHPHGYCTHGFCQVAYEDDQPMAQR